MSRILAAVATLGAALALVSGATAATTTGRLTATDGPGFTITMSAKTVKHGIYVITIHDRSSIHDFHLTGPGLNKATSVAAVKTYTWKVTLKKGTYKFVCDPHKTIMHGVLKVTQDTPGRGLPRVGGPGYGNSNEATGLRPGQPKETWSVVPSQVTSVRTTTAATNASVRRRGIGRRV
jgi:plastocyanin